MLIPDAAAALSRRRLTSALLAAACCPSLVAPPRPALAAFTPAKAAGGQDPVGPDGKIVLSNPPTIDVLQAPPTVTSRCFMDVGIGGKSAGRIVVDLYGEVVPRAAENFRQLCTGEAGFGYAGSSFYSAPPPSRSPAAVPRASPSPRLLARRAAGVVSDNTMQAGALDSKGGGRSIYGPTFAHENYAIKHSVAGLVSMVNSGVGGGSGESDSRFLVQLIDDAGFLDGRYVAVGRVSEGMDVVRAIERVKVSGTKNKPLEPVTIDRAGVLPPPPPPPPLAAEDVPVLSSSDAPPSSE